MVLHTCATTASALPWSARATSARAGASACTTTRMKKPNASYKQMMDIFKFTSKRVPRLHATGQSHLCQHLVAGGHGAPGQQPNRGRLACDALHQHFQMMCKVTEVQQLHFDNYHHTLRATRSWSAASAEARPASCPAWRFMPAASTAPSTSPSSATDTTSGPPSRAAPSSAAPPCRSPRGSQVMRCPVDKRSTQQWPALHIQAGSAN